MSDDLLRYRSEFPILDHTTYLISNSLGAMPRGVSDAMKRYADTWATRGVRAWEERWWMLAAEVGDEIGAIMNAPRGSVATHPNVTTCQMVVASCFDFSGRRNKVVYTDMNFPSVMYFWEAQRDRGARVHMVSTDDGITVPTERLLDAIDGETLLVPISHVLFRSAYIYDAAAIIEKAHKVGAHVLLDTFQSLGTVPVDVQRLNVDFACGGVLKWLCGGPGTAYLYVRPDLGRRLEPKFTGWFAHENPFGFEVGPIRYATSAYRFMNGTTPIPALEAARPGLKIVAAAGIDRIRAKSTRQTARLIDLADRREWTVNTPRDPEKRGGTVSIDMPHSQHVCRELLAREILVDWRPKAGVRMSPHFYTRDEELDTAIAAAEEIVHGPSPAETTGATIATFMSVSYENSKVVFQGIKDAGIISLSALPETWLGLLLQHAERDSAVRLIQVAKEEEAVGIAAGAYFAGERHILLMQNHGFLAAINGIVSLAMLYGIPLCMLIALRGHWGEPYPWHTRGGIVTEGVMRALNIPFEYARSPKEVGRQIREAYTLSQSSLSPVALLLTRDLMEEPL